MPKEFRKINFENLSYPYNSPVERIKISFKRGMYENGSELFSFGEVYYVDLTNDGKKEALVMLGHLSCGASCDGGAVLLYVYQAQRNRLKLLWQYETGAMAYGCGLKSLTVKSGEIRLKLFGRCREDNTTDSATWKFGVKDMTYLVFGFNGKKIVREKKEFIDAPQRDVKNYEPEISINQ